jgi:lysophospholipase L1-like esterase
MVKAGRKGGGLVKRAWLLLFAAWLALGLAAPSAQAGEAGAVVMLGDSLTRQGDWTRLLGRDDVANQGIDGDTSAGVLQRLPGIIAQRPDKIFLMIGINDLRRGGGGTEVAERLLANHQRILAKLRAELPQAQIHVLSLLPVSRSFFSFLPDNRRIAEVNQRLRTLAADLGCAWLDLYPLFLDEEGSLARRFTHDGLHLNAQGYQVWRQALAPLLP